MAEIIFKLAALILLAGGAVWGRGFMKKSVELKYRGVSTMYVGVLVALLSGIVPMLTA